MHNATLATCIIIYGGSVRVCPSCTWCMHDLYTCIQWDQVILKIYSVSRVESTVDSAVILLEGDHWRATTPATNHDQGWRPAK